jgi:mRNA interferase MazF
MGKSVAGDIVVTTFPFSDLSTKKRRPALVLADVEFGDLILCQITSKPYASKTAITIESTDFVSGGLPVVSFVRPDKLFTADAGLIERTVGTLKSEILEVILSHVRNLF